MDKKAQAILIEKYPSFFRNVGGDPRKTCLAYGIECDSGWFDLIDKFCEGVAKLCKNEVDFYFTQIKEKFGMLTIYYRCAAKYGMPINKAITQLNEEIMMESCEVCERCGSRENVSQNERGWVKSYCAQCRAVDLERLKFKKRTI